MLLSLQSTSTNYHQIRTNFVIPWNCDYIKYHIESVNTKNILLTTKEDYIELTYNDSGNEQSTRISFENSFRYTDKDILNLFNKVSTIMTATIDKSCHRLQLVPKIDFKFTHITHRAGLITGLYNLDMTKQTVYKENLEYSFEIPITDYANKLYLISKQGQSIQSNIGNREYTPSVIASIDHVVRDGVPIIVNFETFGKPIKIKLISIHLSKLNSSSLTSCTNQYH